MLSSVFWQGIAESFRTNFIQDNRYVQILEGLETTMVITVCAVLLGTLLGGAICWMRMQRKAWISNIAKVYIEIMHGTPVLVMLMIMYYVVMAPLNASGVFVAIITFAMNTSAYISEMLRTSIEGVDRGQTEAGLSLGLTRIQTFFCIVLPQAVRNVMPIYRGEVISLLKTTSIVGYVAVMDLTKASDMIRARTFDAFFPLITIALVYFLIAWLIGLLLDRLTSGRHRIGKAAAAAAVLLLPTALASCADKTPADRSITCEDDLEGRKVAVILGSISEQLMLDRYGTRNLMSFNTDVDATEAVLKGKADAFIIDDIVATMPLREHSELDTIPTSYPAMPIGACFSKDNKDLAEQFRTFISAMDSAGTNREINARWMGSDLEASHRDIEEVKSGTPLKIAIMPTNPPLNFLANGTCDGYEPELARLFAKEIGRPVEFVNMDFGAILAGIASGMVDMAMASISVTEERSRVMIQIPYSESKLIVMFRKPSATEAAGTETGRAWLWILVAAFAAMAAFLTVRYGKRRNASSQIRQEDDSDVVIRVSHLSKTFGNLKVLRDVNAVVRKGEVISIIGPSGTGKSTFLRCLNLLEKPDTGSIMIDGQDILAPGADVPALRRRMGMVFQSFNLFNGRSILDNITFAPMKILKKSREEAEARAMELLELVGLAEKASAFPEQLSGGQKQRVAIARALAMEPEIILFDEPTSALDPTMVSEVLGVMRTLARQGLTMLVVTHEMRFARDVSTRVFYMDKGIVYEEGTPEQMFGNPRGENTRKFINRIREYRFSISSEKYDYYGMMAGINAFCVKYNMSSAEIDHISHIVEESLLITGITPGTEVTVAYSEKTSVKDISVHTPVVLDGSVLENDANAVQTAILRGICRTVTVGPDGTGSLLHCELE